MSRATEGETEAAPAEAGALEGAGPGDALDDFKSSRRKKVAALALDVQVVAEAGAEEVASAGVSLFSS
jgi:hypothetical protein